MSILKYSGDKVCERYHRIYLEDRKSNSAKACKCHRRWENHQTTRKNKKSASLLGIVRKSLSHQSYWIHLFEADILQQSLKVPGFPR
jgi:hypothetical protein